jgi:hypothetical protein
VDTNAYYAVLGPWFLLLVGLELVAARRRGLRAYVLPDTLANLACGLDRSSWASSPAR